MVVMLRSDHIQIVTEYFAAECLLADAASTSSVCTGGRRTDYSTLMISFNQSSHLEIRKVYPHHAAAELIVPHNIINDSQQFGTISRKLSVARSYLLDELMKMSFHVENLDASEELIKLSI